MALKVSAHHVGASIQLDKHPVRNWKRTQIRRVTPRYTLFLHDPTVLLLLEADGHLSQWYEIILQQQ